MEAINLMSLVYASPKQFYNEFTLPWNLNFLSIPLPQSILEDCSMYFKNENGRDDFGFTKEVWKLMLAHPNSGI